MAWTTTKAEKELDSALVLVLDVPEMLGAVVAESDWAAVMSTKKLPARNGSVMTGNGCQWIARTSRTVTCVLVESDGSGSRHQRLSRSNRPDPWLRLRGCVYRATRRPRGAIVAYNVSCHGGVLDGRR